MHCRSILEAENKQKRPSLNRMPKVSFPRTKPAISVKLIMPTDEKENEDSLNST